MGQVETSVDELCVEDLVDSKDLIVYNDDVNTFDHVIDSLIDVCDHSLEQAEQCATLVHYKGKCSVKSGSLSDLKPRCAKLIQAGLSAEIV